MKSDLRDYVRQTGYVRGGELLPLEDTPLAAHGLLHAVDVVAQSSRPMDDEQLCVISLLQRVDEDEHLAPDPVPDSMTDARGLAYAEAIDARYYDLSMWLDDSPNPEVRAALKTLSDHRKRVEAFDGAAPLSEPEALVEATREIYTALIGNNLGAPVSAHDTLTALF